MKKPFDLRVTIVLIIIGFSTNACNEIEKHKQQLSQRAHHFIFNQKDKLLPLFDSKVPDTESNRRRFKEYLKNNAYC